MAVRDQVGRLRWTGVVPVLAVVVLVATWGSKPAAAVLTLVGVLLAGAVLAAVHHAEVVAHRVGEPFGSLVLAVAVTVIEVALIVTLMVSGGSDDRDAGPRHGVRRGDDHLQRHRRRCRLLVGALRTRVAEFNAEGTATALATVATLATLTLVLPTFTTSRPGPGVLGRAAGVRGRRRRSRSTRCSCSCRPSGTATTSCRSARGGRPEAHAAPPSHRDRAHQPRRCSCVALVAVVGLAKIESPAIEDAVDAIGAPPSAVGVVIALLVLLPETLAAVRNARRDRMQTSFNLALGSAMASIGLTIPAIAVASIWLDGPLVLGLGSTQIVLLAITVVVGALTVLPGRATLQEGGVHLVLFAAFLFLAVNP